MNSNVSMLVQTILNEYLTLLNKQIPNTLEGLYLHGSIALNAYSEGSSDIDFIAVINRPLTELDVKEIANLHKALHQKYKETVMDGCYLLVEDVGKDESEIKNCLYVNEGKIRWSNEGVNPITWWILKNKGITILGTSIDTYDFNVNDKILNDYILKNMNTYWASRLKARKRYQSMSILLPNKLIDLEVEWSITGMLRQFYTLQEREIVSKVEASKYALKKLPERWHNIIKDAISIREGSNIRYYKSKKQRINDMIQCMDYILNTSNANHNNNIKL
ncbi:aminoglycoside adenylyltransferase domain-containing protein [Lysinibacillus irui]|uniref:aminoglycoside adenylyltransferase domain-containing protein n=1 Tax=Lysinibacillus irui TaxID=2998077 RepID=UPI004044656B